MSYSWVRRAVYPHKVMFAHSKGLFGCYEDRHGACCAHAFRGGAARYPVANQHDREGRWWWERDGERTQPAAEPVGAEAE
ncbi:MAG: hypothetical protein OEQ18_08670 [Gammaproteobacteria bacterium]|nr:hypothetical protein [Gammaproteobacteria bacterium]